MGSPLPLFRLPERHVAAGGQNMAAAGESFGGPQFADHIADCVHLLRVDLDPGQTVVKEILVQVRHGLPSPDEGARRLHRASISKPALVLESGAFAPSQSPPNSVLTGSASVLKSFTNS